MCVLFLTTLLWFSRLLALNLALRQDHLTVTRISNRILTLNQNKNAVISYNLYGNPLLKLYKDLSKVVTWKNRAFKCFLKHISLVLELVGQQLALKLEMLFYMDFAANVFRANIPLAMLLGAKRKWLSSTL